MSSEPPTIPVVGIPCYHHGCDTFLGGLGSALPDSYVRALDRVRCAAMLIPATGSEEALAALYRRCDGLLLAGGPDVAPAAYGQKPHPALGPVTPERDRVELSLLRRAIDDRMPLLCICRGIQLLNVGSGGTLWQDLSAQNPAAFRHDLHPLHPPAHLGHEVRVETGSRLHGVVGCHRTRVNSLHHQAIDRLGDGLTVSARSPDGVVEAVEGTGRGWLLGVQWHPEWLVDSEETALRLFEAFAEACRRYRRSSTER
jgi:putative glutamine amidotransferase